MHTVLVFGTFDLFHPGHESFLRQARALGQKLVVSVARDEYVTAIKKKESVQKEHERLENIRRHAVVDEVIFSDNPIGEFRSVVQVNPDIIALGYDQEALGGALRAWMEKTGRTIPIVVLQSHEPEKFKSSKLKTREA